MSQQDASPNVTRIGQKVYMGGVGAQLGFIVVFCCMMVRLFIKMRREPRQDINMLRPLGLFVVTFASLVLIMVCSNLLPLFFSFHTALIFLLSFYGAEFGKRAFPKETPTTKKSSKTDTISN